MDGKEIETIEVNKKVLTDIVDESVSKKLAENAVKQDEEILKLNNKLDLIAKNQSSMLDMPNVKVNEKDHALATYLRAFAVSQLDNIPIDKVLESFKPKYSDSSIAKIEKTMTTGVNVSGGLLVPEVLTSELIPYLYPNSIFRPNGAKVLTLPRGNAKIRKQTGKTTGYWVDENTAPTALTGITLGYLYLNVHKYCGIADFSNDLLRYGDISVDSLLIEDLGLSTAETEDTAFLSGNGTIHSPKGIKNLMDAGNQFAMTATPTSAKIKADLLKAKLLVKKGLKGNVNLLTNLYWLGSATLENSLLSRVNTQDFPMDFAQQLMTTGGFYGAKFICSEIVPDDELYLISMDKFIIGDGLQMNTELIKDAVIDVNGTVKSGVSQDFSVIRLIKETDCGLRYDKAVSLITGISGW